MCKNVVTSLPHVAMCSVVNEISGNQWPLIAVPKKRLEIRTYRPHHTNLEEMFPIHPTYPPTYLFYRTRSNCIAQQIMAQSSLASSHLAPFALSYPPRVVHNDTIAESMGEGERGLVKLG